MDRSDTGSRPGRGLGYFATVAVAVLCLLFGIPILLGGIWLIALGGSWYYAIAGAGLVVTGALLIRASISAVYVYFSTYVFTVIWALWEAGLDGWAQVPRLVAPTVMLVLVLLTLPVLRRHPARETTR